jgi:DNA-binding MarR family transcriptional regulator
MVAFTKAGKTPANSEANMAIAKRAVEAVAQPVINAELKPLYMEALTLVERLHRRLLDVIKDEFDRAGRSDVNSVQALLLFNIGGSELTAGELRTRGYYLGSNVSYNLKKLVEMGYIHHQRSRMDRRSVRVSLTEKGTDVANVVNHLYERHIRSIHQVGGIAAEDFQALNRSLQRLERFWTDQILYRL